MTSPAPDPVQGIDPAKAYRLKGATLQQMFAALQSLGIEFEGVDELRLPWGRRVSIKPGSAAAVAGDVGFLNVVAARPSLTWAEASLEPPAEGEEATQFEVWLTAGRVQGLRAVNHKQTLVLPRSGTRHVWAEVRFAQEDILGVIDWEWMEGTELPPFIDPADWDATRFRPAKVCLPLAEVVDGVIDNDGDGSFWFHEVDTALKFTGTLNTNRRELVVSRERVRIVETRVEVQTS